MILHLGQCVAVTKPMCPTWTLKFVLARPTLFQCLGWHALYCQILMMICWWWWWWCWWNDDKGEYTCTRQLVYKLGWITLHLFTGELYFSVVKTSDFDKKFRCKIKNTYTDVDVLSSTDSIVRLDQNLPEGRLFATAAVLLWKLIKDYCINNGNTT